MRKIKRGFDYVSSLLSRMLREKVYTFESVKLRYIFYPCRDSDAMVVVFSACTKPGVPARYNYIRTLDGIHANRLYILDEGAEDKRGTYYLGAYPGFSTEKAVEKLIEEIARKYFIRRMYFGGSSKGGWAALNFAAHFGPAVKAVIAGAPQYYLGSYLSAPANRMTLKCISGEDTERAVAELNQHLKRKLPGLSKTKIYLHFSTQEHTYQEHIKDLLEDLERVTVIEKDIDSYAEHEEVGRYFPMFFRKCVMQNIAEGAE